MDILKIARLSAIFKIANDEPMSKEDMEMAVQKQLHPGGPVSQDQTAADWLNAPAVSQGEIAVAISNNNGVYSFRPLSSTDEVNTAVSAGGSVVVIDRDAAINLKELEGELQSELKKLYNTRSEDIERATEVAKKAFARIELIKIANLLKR